MSIPIRARNLLLEQAVEAIVPVLGAYGGGAVGALPDVEGAIDRATSVFADRIVARWQDWLKPRSPAEVLNMLQALTHLSTDEARQEAAGVLDRHLLDIRPEDRSFALDYVAGIPAQIKQALVYDRQSSTYHLPPDWSLTSSDALRRFLPLAPELKAAWASGTPARSVGEGSKLQTQPDAPRTVLPVPDVVPPPLPAAVPLKFRSSDLVPKLHVLLRAHWLVFWSQCRRIGLNLAVLVVCIPLGILAGAGVFWCRYENPHRHAQIYNNWPNPTTYYIRGRQVSQQEYDYYLRSNGNEEMALVMAIPSGIALGAGLFALGTWLLWRWSPAAQRILNDQIQTIAETNPDEVRRWGGAAVLRQRALVAEILRLVQKESA